MVVLINEDRENATSDLGFELLTFIQLTNQTNQGSKGGICALSHAYVTGDVTYMV